MKKPKKRRVFQDVYSHDYREEQMNALLDEIDPRLRLYVYRAASGKRVGKAIYIGPPFPHRQLLDHLRDDIGGGQFHVMIRRGRTMEFSGILRIGMRLGVQRHG